MKENILFAVLLIVIIAGNSYSVINFNIASFLVFALIVGFLIYRDRRKVKLQGIVLMRRTQKGKDFIDRTASAHRGFWGTVGNIGVGVAIITLIFGSVFLILQLFTVFEGQQDGGVRLILPGPVSTPTGLPGAFVVPWWMWIIGVAIVIIPHEFMHGIMCRIDKVRIKSVGWILLVIIPGAFVEPDEKQLKRSRRSTKMRVYAAGSFANIVTAFVVMIVLSAMFFASFSPSGVFAQTIEDTPAEKAGLNGTITSINGFPVRNQEDLRMVLSGFRPGDTVQVNMVGGDMIIPSFQLTGADFILPKPAIVSGEQHRIYDVTLGAHPERGTAYLGVNAGLISYDFHGSENDFAVYQTVATMLVWIFIFSLGVGIVNILPIKPLDGGLLFEEIAGKFTKKTKIVVKAVSGIMLAILLFNLLGPILLPHI